MGKLKDLSKALVWRHKIQLRMLYLLASTALAGWPKSCAFEFSNDRRPELAEFVTQACSYIIAKWRIS